MVTQDIKVTPATDRDHALSLLYQMQRIRRFEEACAELYMAQKIKGFIHLYIGEEAIAAGVMPALEPHDRVVATYREHGHALARGISAGACMAEMFGKEDGCSHGRGGSMHLFDATTQFYGGNAIVGGGLPLAVGLALGDRMQGNDAVIACFFGDGAVAEGEFHESINLAALWNLPVLFLCENNLYGMGTHIERAQAQPDLTARAASYGMPAEAVDGMDVLAVEDAARRAVAAVRAGEGPRFLEFKTYRFRAHSLYDPELYRDKSEVEQWKQRDPIATFFARLVAGSLATQQDLEHLAGEADAEIAAAIAFAEASGWEPVEHLERWVYSDGGQP